MSHARGPTWPQSASTVPAAGYSVSPAVGGLPYSPPLSYPAYQQPYHAQHWSQPPYQHYPAQYASPYQAGYAFDPSPIAFGPQSPAQGGPSPVASLHTSPYAPSIELPSVPPTPQTHHLGPSGEWNAYPGATVYNDDGTPVALQRVPSTGPIEQGALAGYPAPLVGPSGFYVHDRGASAEGWYGGSNQQHWPPAPLSPYAAQPHGQYYPGQLAHSRADSGFNSQFSSPALSYSQHGFSPPQPPYALAPYSPAVGRVTPANSNARYGQRHPPPAPPHARYPSAPASAGMSQSHSLGLARSHAGQQQQQPQGPGGQSPRLARGQLAQAKLHGTYQNGGGHSSSHQRQQSGDTRGVKSALPRPPSHSPHAMWVGNVPSDSSHEELYRFFSSRQPPSSAPQFSLLADIPPEILDGLDLDSTGVESVHLIARSNCCFVNFCSDLHLQHAISVANGVSLRPYDPKIKELVARVRKKDEDSKSGVGAQRIGGMHHAYVARLDAERRQAQKAAAEARQATEEEEEGGPRSPYVSVSQAGSQADASAPTSPTSPTSPVHAVRAKRMSTSTTHSLSTASTTSSFLTKHFRFVPPLLTTS